MCIIDRRFKQAGNWVLAGAVLSFFGFIHGMQLGIRASPLVALGNFFLAGLCLAAVWSQGSSGRELKSTEIRQ